MANSFYTPSVGYTLPVCEFTEDEQNKAQSQTRYAMLQALGYNGNSPKEIAFCPEDSGGIGLPNLFVEQGSSQAKLLMGHARTDSMYMAGSTALSTGYNYGQAQAPL